MWATQIFLILLGLSIGFAVAGGLFALIIGMGVVTRFAEKTKTIKHLMLYESCVAWGGALGNALSVFDFPFSAWSFLMPVIGLCSGMFVGSWYMAIAEMINTFPIFSRRVKMLRGMGCVILALAAGKCAGAFIYFFNRW